VPAVRTVPVTDDADDPAIWVNQRAPARSLVLATNKVASPRGAVLAYDLDGRVLQRLGGLDRPTRGTVHFDGRNLYELTPRERSRLRATRLGFVFQTYHLVPELTLLENVRLASMTGRSPIRGREAAARALDLVRKVGLQDRVHHRPDELSGGEQQRAAIARALMNDPDLVLADEPTGNLDSGNGEQVLHHLFEMVRERRHALVLVTHNEAIAARCDRRLELRDGILGETAL